MANPAARRLVDALGGARALRERAATYRGLHERVRAGLPYASLESVARHFALDLGTLAAVLHLPRRTLARRKRDRKLRPDESDRLLRLGRIASLAEEVLGSSDKAARWLQRPNRALGGDIPLHRLDTDLGARDVEALLLRIAHGVYS